MEIRVLGWRYENIRGGLRDATIDIESSCRWTLIQMPNGTGKTTTMSLFRAVFSNEALTADVVREFRSADADETGLFETQLLVDGKPFRCQLRLDYRDGSHSYWTARSALREGGLEEGWLLPAELRRLFHPDFVRLFVFDGELAKEIRAVGKERATQAIRTLYRLDRLKELHQQVIRVVEAQQERAAAISTATEQKGVRRWLNQLTALNRTKELLLHEQTRQQGRQAALEKRKTFIAAQISSHIEQDDQLKQRKADLDEQRRGLDRDILELTLHSLGLLRSPARLHPRILARLQGLGDRLNKLKLPKTVSEEFFRELAQQNECVCGRTLGDAERAAILDGAQRYLADDQIAVINKMKLMLRESVANEQEFTSVIQGLKSKLRGLRENQKSQDRLEIERVEAGDTELERLRNELRTIDGELQHIAAALLKLTTKDMSRQTALGCSSENNLPKCEAEIKRCELKLETATKTRRFARQADVVKQLLCSIEAIALEKLRERVRQATNKKLEVLAPSEGLRVARISGSLELEANKLASKSSVSEGQSLAVAYAFLTSLLADAPYRLPFIVDSPAVSLDIAVRREVGTLIPDLFGQMIVFVISSERAGFADSFYERQETKYFTLWRESQEVTQVRTGLPFFQQFHAQDVEV